MNKKLIAKELIYIAKLIMIAEKEIDPKYQNKDDTFKDMKPIDDPSGASNGFNGCVRYMINKNHKGLSKENAEKLCGWIKQHKG